jgi:hypothetical protein
MVEPLGYEVKNHDKIFYLSGHTRGMQFGIEILF